MLRLQSKLDKAKVQAQANADYFNRPYKVFTDTSGNIRVERWGMSDVVADYVFYPRGPQKDTDFYRWQ